LVIKLFPGKKRKDFLRASSTIVGKGTDHKLRALPFLYLDSFALYAALSARLAFFALCYRAIAGFLLFKTKTKGSYRVNTSYFIFRKMIFFIPQGEKVSSSASVDPEADLFSTSFLSGILKSKVLTLTYPNQVKAMKQAQGPFSYKSSLSLRES
jgi:hypothetical protein